MFLCSCCRDWTNGPVGDLNPTVAVWRFSTCCVWRSELCFLVEDLVAMMPFAFFALTSVAVVINRDLVALQ